MDGIVSCFVDYLAGIASYGPWALSPQTLGPWTLGPTYSKSLGPRGWGPKILWAIGPRPLGPWDLRYLGLKVWGPKVWGLKAQGLMALESASVGKITGVHIRCIAIKFSAVQSE